ncbi:MAG: methylthioribose-1-phosphate isomerase [Candidatus Accumulibacter vicinus]|uniref:Methylthioribose-1-phosphate isomerase n=1 Tax=Candidatus Accumulibacter vicinus TaxID=2954382 RepID=A0A084Y664_9PROT|nr:MAG: methylthioribose-1-phosphate isomerase [Candidatus Accumulibacter vicinus]
MRLLQGCDAAGRPAQLRQLAAETAVANPAFDITPASLISAVISERGVCSASSDGLRTLYPEATHD